MVPETRIGIGLAPAHPKGSAAISGRPWVQKGPFGGTIATPLCGTMLHRTGVRGEGSIPVPLPPPSTWIVQPGDIGNRSYLRHG
jgi:hypothetical protein